QAFGLEPRHFGGTRDDNEARLLSILEERLQPANRLRQLDELRGKPAGTHEPPVLEQHAEQHLHPFARGAGQLEQAERMSGRRRIKDDQVEARGGRSTILFRAQRCPWRSMSVRLQQIGDSQYAEKLVDARRCEIYQLADPTSAAKGVDSSLRTERGDNFIERRFQGSAPGTKRGC